MTTAHPLAAMLLLVSTAAAHADGAADAASATRDLYTRISARDPGVLRHVPAEGFDELGAGSTEWHRLDAGAFERLFRSDRHIALRAEDVRARPHGNVVVVTGVRVGSVTPAGQQPEEARLPFTMVWMKVDGTWQLRHVHLSAPDSRRAP